ncbi:MAG: DUF1847 domain-containing protein [Candidatus Lokiarchaeota archaeon]|nr:DUF1847 domain-containing protein [Candidatus Lokiarchaeota archaeon]
MNKFPEALEKARKIYEENEEIREWAKTASIVEAEGYCEWPRLKDTVEFAKKMNFKKIGIACCIGLINEAKKVADIITNYGFEANVVMCKTGGLKKSELGLSDDFIMTSKTGYLIGTVSCNPTAQATILNEVQTDMNIIVGLCVGHDMVFTKLSEAPVTTLIAKDRRLNHNPASILYTHYGRSYVQKDLSQSK